MSHRRPIRSVLAVSACAVAVFGALAAPAGAAPAPASAVNLLRNAGAESGAASVHGWDAVTIPGWSVAAGTAHGGAPTGTAGSRRGAARCSSGAPAARRASSRRSPWSAPAEVRCGPEPATRSPPSWRHHHQPRRRGGRVSLRRGPRTRSARAGARGRSRALGRERPQRALADGEPAARRRAGPRDAHPGDLAHQRRRAQRAARGLRPRHRRRHRLRRARAPPGPPALGRPRARSPLRPRVPLLLREPGRRARSWATPAGAVPTTACCRRAATRRVLRRGAPARRQLPGPGRRQRVRDPAGRPAGVRLAVHHPRAQHRRPRQRCAARPGRRTTRAPRPVRRHGARLLLERRPADAVLRRHPRAPGLLRRARAAARSRCAPDLASAATTPNFVWVGSERLRRHGGLRHPRGRSVPGSSSWARSCAPRPGAPSARWPSSPGTRTTTTTSVRPSGCRRSSWARVGSNAASSRRSATRTTACCARSRVRWASVISPRTTSTPSRSTTSSRAGPWPAPLTAAPRPRRTHRPRCAPQLRRHSSSARRRAPSPRSRCPRTRRASRSASGATRRRSR